jgi:hypothetical protein
MNKTPALEIIIEKEHFSIQDEVRYQLRPYELFRHIMIMKYPVKITFKRREIQDGGKETFIYWR